MSYKTYTTEAIVCGSRVNNTSDKSFLLFTREAGMLWASAKSVREERSRQRFALQEFSLIRVSLVRGKSGWRIGSAECERNYFSSGKGAADKLTRGGVSAILKLLRQFIRGEISHPDVFDDTKTALDVAGDGRAEGDHLLSVFSLRLLSRLGYIAPSHQLKVYLEAVEWWTLPPLSTSAHAAILKAKQASHL
jgi:recombinational DNA repair protein (RecF pathway)